jgi:type I restriction enzyme S subunit
MNEFIDIELSELGETITGKTPSSKNPEDFGFDYMFVTPSDNWDVKLIERTERYVSQLGLDKLSNKALPPKSVMVSCIGSAMGKILMNSKRCITNQQINSIIVNDKSYDGDYVYYLLVNNYKALRTAATGSTSLPLLNKTDFDALKLKVHKEKTTQKQIAKVLSDLDAKIEVNNKINAALEALAKTIYDYWFVQFDFPCPEALEGQEHLAGKPYKSSGGKMVYNEELKREIPEGWEVKELNELLEVGKEQVNPASNPEKEFKHISIPVFDSTETYGIEKGNEIASSKFVVTEYDIAVSKLNPWFNRVFYPLDEQDLICTTEMVVWKCKEIKKKNFFFELAKSQHFIAYSTQNATGTSNSHKRVNPTIMMKYKLPYSKEQIEKFGDLVNPWIKKVMSNKKENQKLAALRDWLLPMLMNGQVTHREEGGPRS